MAIAVVGRAQGNPRSLGLGNPAPSEPSQPASADGSGSEGMAWRGWWWRGATPMPIIAQETRKADVRFPEPPSCDDAKPPRGGRGADGRAASITGTMLIVNPGCYPFVHRRRFCVGGYLYSAGEPMPPMCPRLLRPKAKPPPPTTATASSTSAAAPQPPPASS